MRRLSIVLVLALTPLTASAQGRVARRVVRSRPVAQQRASVATQTPVAAMHTPMLVQLLRKFAAESREKR